MMRPFSVTLAVFLATIPAPVNAGKARSAKHHSAKGQAIEERASSRDVNLRESCRKAASGIYLNAWDHKSQTASLLKGIETKKKAIDVSLANETKTLATMRGQVAASNYDLGLAQKIDTQSGLVQTLENQATEMKNVLGTARKDAAAASAAESATRHEVTTVFDIIGKPRPQRLEFKASCPKYRYLCPLPRDHAIRLREFAERDTAIAGQLESCARYADQSIQATP